MPEIKKFLDGNGLKFGLEYLLENMSVSASQSHCPQSYYYHGEEK